MVKEIRKDDTGIDRHKSSYCQRRPKAQPDNNCWGCFGYWPFRRNNQLLYRYIYLLTRRIGSQDVLYGEFLDLRTWENRIRKADKNFRGKADVAGRFAIKGKEDNFCIQMIIGTSPELYLSAPWAQVRFQDVCCSRNRVPLTGDPFQRQYMPGGSNLYPAYTYNPQLQEG